MQKLFEKNLRFFYSNLPEYYELLKKIKKRNFFVKNDNIYDIGGNRLYPNSISEDIKQIVNMPTHNPLWRKNFLSIEPMAWDERKFPHTGSAINHISREAKKLKSYLKNSCYFEGDFMPATVILGLLSGKHVDELVRRYDFHSLFVYEPNPEFFAVSLYFVDYAFIYEKLGERFFLWVNGEVGYEAVEKFYYERIVSSSFLNLVYESYSHPLIENAKRRFDEIRMSKFRGWGTFEDESIGVNNHNENINRYPMLNNKRKKLDVPFCVVANGKSLEKNMEFIKKNRNSMIIVSVGTAITPLLKEGIHSDFHIEQERIELLKTILKKPLKEYKGCFVGASVVNPAVFGYAKHPMMFIREGFTLSKNHALVGSSPLVGNSGVAFASLFSDEIYLCGMDLGFRLNEKKHSKNSFYDTKNDIATKGIKAKGNFSDDIYTNSLFLSSKRKIETLISALKLNVYNLSDGVYIQHTTPLKDKTLPEIDKNGYIEKIYAHFTDKTLDREEINIKNVLEKTELSLKSSIDSVRKLTGVVDFLEDVLKSDPSPSVKILKGSLYHYLFNIYLLYHKLSAEDFKLLTEKIDLKSFFPDKL